MGARGVVFTVNTILRVIFNDSHKQKGFLRRVPIVNSTPNIIFSVHFRHVLKFTLSTTRPKMRKKGACIEKPRWKKATARTV